MHQHRRRKKRPSYGIRTIEITRGKNGFGFTISGQAPCILSCIIAGSPAEKAGLKTGDFLIAVNGENVSKALHDDVVRLIGNSNGVIKLQIAANYYSDSSDEEFSSIMKLRPKYPHKTKHRQLQNSVSRAEKVVQDLKTGALFVDHVQGADVPQKQTECSFKISDVGLVSCSRSNKALLDLILQQPLPDASRISLLNIHSQKGTNQSSTKQRPPGKKKEAKVQKRGIHDNLNTSSNSPAEVFHSIFTEQDLNSILYPAVFTAQTQYKKNGKTPEQTILKAVVGYLGTIEMPKESQIVNSRLQTIRNCIRRLRIEKKVHTLVLMTVFSECIILISPDNLILAEFAADKITFCGVYSDDKKFFGLVTTHGTNEDTADDTSFISSSCHVFMVDPKLTPHHQHIKIAKAFRVSCTSDSISEKCKEFPDSADAILQAVVGLYRSKVELNVEAGHGLEFDASMSPQPSNTSTNSSNSDSGIGFRDEGFLLPDASLCSLSISQENGFISSKSVSPPLITNENSSSSVIVPICRFDRLTVRAMPDPVGYEEHIDTPPSIAKLCCMHQFMRETDNGHLSDGSCDSQICTVEKCHEENSLMEMNNQKLSPKVYDLSLPLKLTEGISLDFDDTIAWKCSACNVEDLDVQQEMFLPMHQLCSDQGADVFFSCTQADGVSLSENSEDAQDMEITRKWGRTSSLRRYLGRKRSLLRRTHEAVSDGELANGKVSTSSSMLVLDHISHTSLHSCCMSDRPLPGGRAASWADSFSILLEDPIGLHAFSEFLKKEFSEENIAFWISCEQYRQIKNQSELAKMAQEIYSNHLCIGAQEPVNVDSHARQIAQEGLDSPTSNLFLPAQKQIFNLMKFDCYQRFLKSPIFQESVFCEMQGKPLPYTDQVFEEDNEKRKVYDAEKKKKSLIPWHKLSKSRPNQSKCKARKLWDKHNEVVKAQKKCKYKVFMKLDDSSSLQSDVTSSRSSLTGSEPERDTKIRNLSSRELPSQSACQNVPLAIVDNERLNACMKDTLSRLSDWSSNHSGYIESESLKALSAYPDFETLTNHIFEDLLNNQPELPCNGLDVIDISSNDEKKGIKTQVIF